MDGWMDAALPQEQFHGGNPYHSVPSVVNSSTVRTHSANARVRPQSISSARSAQQGDSNRTALAIMSR